MVNSFLGREPILPNGQVSIRWVRTLIARLMSWQERWVLTFDKPLIIRLPQERMLMRGRTKRWDESTLLMTVKHVKFALSLMTVVCIFYTHTHTHMYLASDVWCVFELLLRHHNIPIRPAEKIFSFMEYKRSAGLCGIQNWIENAFLDSRSVSRFKIWKKTWCRTAICNWI